MPGMRLLVAFEGDPGWHHERILQWPVADDRWVVLTGDGDSYAEGLDEYDSWIAVPTGATEYPIEVRNVVAFENVPSRSDLWRYIRQGKAEAHRICAVEGRDPINPAEWLDDFGPASPDC